MPLTPKARPRLSRWRWSIGLGVLGAVAGLGQAPFDIAPLFVLVAAVLFHLQIQSPSIRRALLDGWAFGAGYFALTLHWIVQPFLVEPEIHGWMAPFALVLMAGGLGLFWGLAFALAKKIAPTGARAALALAVVWSAEETLRSYIFTGFPWVLPGHIWANAPQLALSAWVGPHGLTLLTLGAAASLGVAVATRRGMLVLPFAALLGVGAILAPGPAPIAKGPLVRIVQPNAPQHQKFDPDFIPVFLNRLMTGTAAGPRPDLVVWPETAVPYLLEWSDDILAQASDLAHGAPVVTGINRRDGDRYYNTLVMTGLGGVPMAVYDKEHLVPFGEYVPFGDVLGQFGIEGLAASQGGGFSAGAGRGLIDIPGIGLARALICYEASFAEEILPKNGDRPNVLLLITNDAWFGTFAGPYQHLAHARMRAVEQGLPLIRAANTGVSALIDAKGRVIARLALGRSGYVDATLPAPLPETLYARTGDWPVIGFIALSLLLCLYFSKKPVDRTRPRP